MFLSFTTKNLILTFYTDFLPKFHKKVIFAVFPKTRKNPKKPACPACVYLRLRMIVNSCPEIEFLSRRRSSCPTRLANGVGISLPTMVIGHT